MSQLLNLRKSSKPAPKKTLKRIMPSPGPKTSSARINAPTGHTTPAEITWEAPSFYFNPEKRYLSLIITGLALGGGGIIFFSGDMLSAIFLLLSSLVLVLYSKKSPEISRVSINSRGVSIGNAVYFHKDIRSFWIHYQPGEIKELSLELRKWYMPYVKVSIEKKNPLLIRSLLVNFVAEREHEHSLVDIISRKIGL